MECPCGVPSLHYSNWDRDSSVKRQGFSCQPLLLPAWMHFHEAQSREWGYLGPSEHERHGRQRESPMKQAQLTPVVSAQGPGHKGLSSISTHWPSDTTPFRVAPLRDPSIHQYLNPSPCHPQRPNGCSKGQEGVQLVCSLAPCVSVYTQSQKAGVGV